MTDGSDYYVYVLLDSSKPGEYIYGDFKFHYEPFYVGKGRKNRIKDTLYARSSFKGKKIKKLRDLGIEILTIKILESLSNQESIEREIEIISIIGRRDNKKGPLVNTTDGGDGRRGSKPTEETRNKISTNRKGKTVGWKHSPDTLEIMSRAQTREKNGFWGKTHSLTVKQNHSNKISGLNHPMLGKNHTQETSSKLKEHREKNIDNQKIKESCQKFNKAVLMYDLNMVFLKEFESVKEASESTKINASIISKCCRGDIKSPTRYYFKYKYQKDLVKNNKFKLSIGDTFKIDDKEYKLIKRNKKTCICQALDQLETLHVKDYPFLFDKDIILGHQQ